MIINDIPYAMGIPIGQIASKSKARLIARRGDRLISCGIRSLRRRLHILHLTKMKTGILAIIGWYVYVIKYSS